MQIYPEVQEKAQQELDTLLVDRLPSPADRKQLPYIVSVTSFSDSVDQAIHLPS